MAEKLVQTSPHLLYLPTSVNQVYILTTDPADLMLVLSEGSGKNNQAI